MTSSRLGLRSQWGWAAVILLSVGTFALFYQMHDNWDLLASSASDLLDGHAHWRAWQARILAPSLVAGISATGVPFTQAYVGFLGLGFLVHNLLLFGLLRRIGLQVSAAVAWVLFYCAAFLFLNDDYFFAWDILDISVFTLLAYLAVTQASLWAVSALFLLAMLNRETALFIALWLVLDGIRGWGIFDWRRLSAGLGLAAVGVVYTKLARDAWFISMPDGTLDAGHTVQGNHFYLMYNLERVFGTNWTGAEALHTAAVLGFVVFLVLRFRSFLPRQKRLALIVLAYAGSVMMFGVFNETRMHLPLVSLFIFLVIDLYRPGLVGAAARSGG